LFFLDLEASVTEFTSKPSNPYFVLEGQDITVEWSYTFDGEVGSATFNNVTGAVKVEMGKQFGTGNVTLNQERFSAEVLNTQLRICAVQISDQGKYELIIFATGVGNLGDVVEVIVQCKYLQITIKVVSISRKIQDSVRTFLTPRHS